MFQYDKKIFFRCLDVAGRAEEATGHAREGPARHQEAHQHSSRARNLAAKLCQEKVRRGRGEPFIPILKGIDPTHVSYLVTQIPLHYVVKECFSTEMAHESKLASLVRV